MWPVKRIKLARIWFSSSSELDKHPLGGIKYYFNHPEMLTPSTNVSFKTTPWGSHRLKMPRDKLSLQRMSRWNPMPFLQYSAIFVVFVFICMFRSKGSVVNIYINIYPVQSTFISFSLKTYEYIERKKSYSALWENPSWHHKENKVCFRTFYHQLSPFHPNITVYTRIFAFLRLVLHLFFISNQNK